MLFNSVQYMILLGLSAGLYWALPVLWLRQTVLLTASAVFYISWSGKYFAMLVAVVLAVWAATMLVRPKLRIPSALLSIVGLLLLLATFKYANFFSEQFNAALIALGFPSEASHWRSSLILPLGISFYTFQIIAYVVDSSVREIVPRERNPFIFGLFIFFFPQLIAGPICRTVDLMPQLKELKRFDAHLFTKGIYLLLAGFVLKSCIADGIAPYVNVIFSAPLEYSGLDNLKGTIGFAIQIFSDFAGYSLMALGSAALFGYTLPRNFNLPYLTLSIRDFWRHWHITLSRWLRDYLYIPLGGSRGPQPWQPYAVLMTTMVLGGLWHGANWTFVIWGALHGMALAGHRLYLKTPLAKLTASINPLSVAVSWVTTMFVVLVGWVLFRADSISTASSVYARIADIGPGWAHSRMDSGFLELALIFVPLHILIHWYSVGDRLQRASFVIQYAVLQILALIAVIYYVRGTDFIYFQF